MGCVGVEPNILSLLVIMQTIATSFNKNLSVSVSVFTSNPFLAVMYQYIPMKPLMLYYASDTQSRFYLNYIKYLETGKISEIAQSRATLLKIMIKL